MAAIFWGSGAPPRGGVYNGVHHAVCMGRFAKLAKHPGAGSEYVSIIVQDSMDPFLRKLFFQHQFPLLIFPSMRKQKIFEGLPVVPPVSFAALVIDE